MAGKVVNSSFVLLSKFVASRKESASKTATSHIRKTLAENFDNKTEKQRYKEMIKSRKPKKRL